MKRHWPWFVLALAVAVAGHVAIVAAMPRIVNFAWLTMLKSAGMNVNELSNGVRAKVAGRDIVGYDNPDNMPSFLLYDVSTAPLRLRVPVIRDAAYWSLSAVDYGTNVFLLVRGRDVKDDELSVVLREKDQVCSPRPGERVVTVPTVKGVVLIRTIMRDRYDRAEVARLAREKAKGYAEVVTAR